MSLLKRMMYMGLGAFLVLALVVGGVVVFAQEGDDETPDAEQEGEAQNEEEAGAEESDEPEVRVWRHGIGPASLCGDDESLAEVLGISVEELEEARQEMRAAIVEQALDEGLITEAQAEDLLEGNRPFGLGRSLQELDVDADALFAEALGISVEELEEARREARLAQLQEMVDAGMLTQEQADLIAAREAVQGYVDFDALEAAMQNAYEEAIDAALEDGAITEEQAEQVRENAPSLGRPSFGGFRFDGGRGFHWRGGGPSGDVFLPDLAPGASAPTLDAIMTFDA